MIPKPFTACARWIACLLIASVVLPLCPALAAENSFDITLKIGQLDKNLALLETFQQNVDPSLPSLVSRVQSMTFGTDWIDSRRQIVLGMNLTTNPPAMAALIPFTRPNTDFQNAYRPLLGPDYYIVPLPPGRQQAVPKEVHSALIELSSMPQESFISLDLAVKSLLDQNSPQIQALLNQIQNPPAGQSQGPGPSSQETAQMVVNLLNLFKQVDRLKLALDFTKTLCKTNMEVTAFPGTEVAKLLSSAKGQTARLQKFSSTHQIRFASRAYDAAQATELMASYLGGFYKSLGIDMAGIKDLADRFTGETAGGISFQDGKAQIEEIFVMKKAEPEFLEAVYIPWMKQYSEQMAAMLEKNLGKKFDLAFERAAESTIEGHKVLGIKTQFPFLSFAPDFNAGNSEAFLKTEMRLTTVGDLLLMASTDSQMKKLIAKANQFVEKPASGPLATAEIDISAYIGAIAGMIPELAQRPVPKTQDLKLAIDMGQGRGSMSAAIRIADIRALSAYFTGTSAESIEKVEAEAAEKAETELQPTSRYTQSQPEYWMEKANLFSTYGNDAAAIKAFEKVLQLDPQNGDAYFYMGVSYGEIEAYELAIRAIDKAIELHPQKAVYYYGRGRVYLISGESRRAEQDFLKAAELGDPDAERYLSRTDKAGAR